MAFTVDFYVFSKRDNSTARPSGSPSASYSCTLKDRSGVVSPVIVLNLGQTTNPTSLNYCHIAAFGRYYHVTEWTFEKGLWSASLRTDVLATYKTEIGAASLYVLRSAADFDGGVSDGMYPIKTGITVRDDPYANNWWSNYGDSPTIAGGGGCYIVGLLSYIDSTSTFGGINYACFSPMQMQEFLKTIYSPNGNPYTYDYLSKRYHNEYTTDEIANMSYTVENPFLDYVKSVMWIPGGPANTVTRTGLWMGSKEFPELERTELNATQPFIFRASWQRPYHPQFLNRGWYTNCEPYTESYLLLPRAGLVKVDNSAFAEADIIYLEMQLDPISGMAVFILYATYDDGGLTRRVEYQRFSAKVGVNIALSDTKDIGEMLTALLSGVPAAVSLIAGDTPGAIVGAGAAITNIRRAAETNGGTIGSNDGFLGLQNDYRTPHLISIFHEIAADDPDHNGRPLCQIRQISTLPGYNKVLDGDIAIAGTAGEQSELRTYLEEGFYYE